MITHFHVPSSNNSFFITSTINLVSLHDCGRAVGWDTGLQPDGRWFCS